MLYNILFFAQTRDLLNNFVKMRVYGVLNGIQHALNNIGVLEGGNDIIPPNNSMYLISDCMDEWEH